MNRRRRVTTFKEQDVANYTVAVFQFTNGKFGVMLRPVVWVDETFSICYTPDHKRPQECSSIDAAFAYGQTLALIRSAGGSK